MKAVLALLLLLAPLCAQPTQVSATQIRRKAVKDPLTVTNGCALTYVIANARFECIWAAGGATVNAQTGTTYTYLDGDRGKLVTHTNASAIAGTLPQANGSTFISGWYIDVQNRGAGTLTITPTTSTIDGAATLVIPGSQGARIVSDGSNYYTQRGLPSGNISVTSVSVGAGTGVAGTVDFPQGSVPASFPSNTFSLYAPASIGTSYQWLVPAADAAGVLASPGSGVASQLAIVAMNGSGNITRATSPGFATLTTGSNCTSSASPAVCGSALAGSVVVAAAATTVVVNTTAVTANSQIVLTFDSSLGTKLGVTCNTTIPTQISVSARTAATSFTITLGAAPAVNPGCFSFLILN